ncbi:hypothetical protein GF361_03195 [Candidatus Woesearchaeota archaeon]|nr:hypothetical protein [Candidatus Woesearchaeota archaeon]
MVKYLVQIGVGFIFLGIIIIFLAGMLEAEKGESKVAVGGIIGFIPFGFANDKRIFWFMMIFTAIVFFFGIITWMWR